ncbi:cid11 [Symbiodinium sp. CCMP2592]|nr:cid11 [Symbiodinium sp. CCMP2592]
MRGATPVIWVVLFTWCGYHAAICEALGGDRGRVASQPSKTQNKGQKLSEDLCGWFFCNKGTSQRIDPNASWTSQQACSRTTGRSTLEERNDYMAMSEVLAMGQVVGTFLSEMWHGQTPLHGRSGTGHSMERPPLRGPQLGLVRLAAILAANQAAVRKNNPGGKGLQNPKGKGKHGGKMPGKGQEGSVAQAAATVPQTSALPSAPATLPPSMPATSAPSGAPSAPTSEQLLLRALVAHVQSQDGVPSELAHLMGQFQDESHKATGRTLHKLVSKQQEARKGLSKVRADRSAYEGAWSSYLSHMVQLLEKQLEDRSTTLAAYDQSEDAWQKQLEESTAELGRHATQPESTERSEPIDVDAEMEAQEQMVADAAEEEAKLALKRQLAREQSESQAREVLHALKTAQATLTAPSLAVQWRHSVESDYDYVDGLRAQLLGLVVAHEVLFQKAGFLLVSDEDPRIATGLEQLCTGSVLSVDDSVFCMGQALSVSGGQGKVEESGKSPAASMGSDGAVETDEEGSLVPSYCETGTS